MIVAGDVRQFALECEVSKSDAGEGKVFIVIKGKRFGSKSGDFNLSDFFSNIKFSLKAFNPVLPTLYSYSMPEIFVSLDAVWEDSSVDNCPIDKAIPGFFDDPTDVTRKIVFYGGDYAFDGVSIVMISNGEESHLMVRDEEDMRLADIYIDDKEFEERFVELSEKWDKRNRTQGVN